MVVDLQEEIDSHLAEEFPSAIEMGTIYGGVDPLIADAGICDLAAGLLQDEDRERLGHAVMELRHAIDTFPPEAAPYFERLLGIGALALYLSR